MKNESVKITGRYIIIIISVVCIVLTLNTALLLFIVRYSPLVKEPVKTVKAIAEELGGGNRELTQKTTQIIKENNLWVQLVNPEGKVIFQYNNPEDINKQYSLTEIAKLSKSYLKDYPVYVWESGVNLVILGYPKHTISRYNWSIPTNTFHSLPLTLLVIMTLNLTLTIVLSILLSRQLTKPLSNIMNGISSLKEEREVALKEKGVFKSLAQSINDTSQIIQEKNQKIKLRNTAVSNWVTGISHDIRTPLSMIMGYAALMEEDTDLQEEVRTQARIITENALRLRELVDNLNLATSLQYHLLPLHLSSVRLANIARKAMAECMNSGVLKNCSIDLIIEDESISVPLDESLFLRVLTNLITNSARHNPAGCHITVTIPAVKESSHISIMVSDTGSGILREKIHQILGYDYFSAWINQSHGLGLIIVRSIVEAHHGHFYIESEKGKGTVVTIRIPVW